MKELGYPLTWVTKCFIDGGCNARVFAHTNGSGDFVLFDALGPPWPVHDCYLHRACLTWATPADEDPIRAAEIDGILARLRARKRLQVILTADLDEATTRKYERELTSKKRDIEPVTALDYLAKGELQVIGYVQDIVENAVTKQLERLARQIGCLGDVIEKLVAGKLRNHKTQITVVDGDFQSFTAFADTSAVPVGQGDAVLVTLKAEKPLLPKFSGRHEQIRFLRPFFLCVGLERMPKLRRKGK